MRELLYWIVGIITAIHNKIMTLNDAYEMHFTDKELHFLVVGVLGMGMIFVVYPLFKYLAKHNHEMIIAWIYVFTVIVGLTFAIEIGQKVTGTGNMEFADIAFGIAGFIAMFTVFALLRRLARWAVVLVNRIKNNKSS